MFGVARGDSVGFLVVDLAVAIACLEVGYLAAIILPALAGTERNPRTATRQTGGAPLLSVQTLGDPCIASVPLAPVVCPHELPLPSSLAGEG
jgi:hypothetical protein